MVCQNGVQNDSKSNTKLSMNKQTLLGPSWDHLGPVLGHFGLHLLVTNHKQPFVFIRFCEHSCFDKDKFYNRVLDQSWVDLGSNRVQNECKNGRPFSLHKLFYTTVFTQRSLHTFIYITFFTQLPVHDFIYTTFFT